MPDAGQLEKRDWLIWDGRSECWWGPNGGGYWKSIEHAGLYTEAEAKSAETSARRSSERKERAVHISEHREGIERLAAALAASPSPVSAPSHKEQEEMPDTRVENLTLSEPGELPQQATSPSETTAPEDLFSEERDE